MSYLGQGEKESLCVTKSLKLENANEDLMTRKCLRTKSGLDNSTLETPSPSPRFLDI